MRHSPLAILALVCVGTACEGGAPASAIPQSSAVAPVSVEILGQRDDPPGAPGRRLTLVRYTIQPGTELDPHVHPGIQVGHIVTGTLAYEVLSGTVTIHRNVGDDGVAVEVEELTGPTTTELHAGDTVMELDSMLHLGANRSSEPIVILTTLLTDRDAPLSVAAPAGLPAGDR